MDNRIRNGAIVGILVVVVVVLVLLFVVPKANVCKLQAEPPKVDATKVTNFKTSDFKSMANFVGYLVYTKEVDKKPTDTFLGLDLKSIEEKGSLKDQKEPAKLKLATSCADVTVVLPSIKDESWPFYFEIDNISSDGDKSTCVVGTPKSIKADQYYSCQKPQVYECKDKDSKVVARLHVDRLEFEVDGDPNAIKKDNFSKTKLSC